MLHPSCGMVFLDVGFKSERNDPVRVTGRCQRGRPSRMPDPMIGLPSVGVDAKAARMAIAETASD